MSSNFTFTSEKPTNVHNLFIKQEKYTLDIQYSLHFFPHFILKYYKIVQIFLLLHILKVIIMNYKLSQFMFICITLFMIHNAQCCKAASQKMKVSTWHLGLVYQWWLKYVKVMSIWHECTFLQQKKLYRIVIPLLNIYHSKPWKYRPVTLQLHRHGITEVLQI